MSLKEPLRFFEETGPRSDHAAPALLPPGAGATLTVALSPERAPQRPPAQQVRVLAPSSRAHVLALR